MTDDGSGTRPGYEPNTFLEKLEVALENEDIEKAKEIIKEYKNEKAEKSGTDPGGWSFDEEDDNSIDPDDPDPW